MHVIRCTKYVFMVAQVDWNAAHTHTPIESGAHRNECVCVVGPSKLEHVHCIISAGMNNARNAGIAA